MNKEHWELSLYIESIIYSLKQTLIEEVENSFTWELDKFHPRGDP